MSFTVAEISEYRKRTEAEHGKCTLFVTPSSSYYDVLDQYVADATSYHGSISGRTCSSKIGMPDTRASSPTRNSLLQLHWVQKARSWRNEYASALFTVTEIIECSILLTSTGLRNLAPWVMSPFERRSSLSGLEETLLMSTTWVKPRTRQCSFRRTPRSG